MISEWHREILRHFLTSDLSVRELAVMHHASLSNARQILHTTCRRLDAELYYRLRELNWEDPSQPWITLLRANKQHFIQALDSHEKSLK